MSELPVPPWLPGVQIAFKESRMTLRELSDVSGVGYDRLNKILRGDVAQPRGDALQRITDALGIGGRYQREGLVPANLVRQGQIPVLGEVAAGMWLEYSDEAPEPLFWSPFTLSVFPERSVYGLRVKGDSIDRVAEDGQILVVVDLVSTGISLVENDLAIIERRKSQEGIRELTAKRVRWQDGEFWLMPESTNPKWQTQKFRLADTCDDVELRAIGRVEYVLKRP